VLALPSQLPQAPMRLRIAAEFGYLDGFIV
jgi:hypothetical protein